MCAPTVDYAGPPETSTRKRNTLTYYDFAASMPDPNNLYGLIAFIAVLAFAAFVAWLFLR